MNKLILSAVNVLILLTILNACSTGASNDATSTGTRQSQVTISASPLFPYDPLRANKYSLLVSNNTSTDLVLVNSTLISSSLPESIGLNDVLNSLNCQQLSARSNCIVNISLPYVKDNGYINFRLNYQDKLSGKKYPVSKLITFARDIPESNGMVYSLKYMENIVVNSDKFTIAFPFILKQDYENIELQSAGVKPSGYSEIRCEDKDYKEQSNCSALVELDSHIANPKLSLLMTDKLGVKHITNLALKVEFNDTAHLVYLNAPVIIRADTAATSVTVVNIGTATASNLTVPWVAPRGIDLTQRSDCGSQLALNASCKLTYGQSLGAAGGVGTHQQVVNYNGGSKGIQANEFKVYRNVAALKTTSIDSVYPTNNEIVDDVKPIIAVSFSQAVDSDTVNDNSFYVTQGTNTTHLAGTIGFSANNVITFTPTADLTRGLAYKIHLKTNQIGNRVGKVSTIPNATEVIDFTIKQSAKVTVIPDSATEVMMGDSFKFSTSIDVGSSRVTAAFANPLDGVITSNPTTCDLNAAGTKNCNFTATVTAYSSWNTSLANSLSSNYQIVVRATNNAQITGSPLSFSMSTPTVYLAATGQTATTPITATEGMDGWYQAGAKVSSRFTIGKGAEANCITDNLTGLMWIRDLNTVNGGKAMWHLEAFDLIAKSNTTSGFCGHSDWYIPTINELSSLINYGVNTQILLNTQGFDNVKGSTAYDMYWSSTSYFNTTADAWGIYFFDGGGFTANVGMSLRNLWPVRRNKISNTHSYPGLIPITGESGGMIGSDNGVIWPNPRFIVGRGVSNNCVTDKLTGLMWIKDLNTVVIKNASAGKPTGWQNALDSIKQANSADGYCGYNDWRLPNINELNSKFNYSQIKMSDWLNFEGFSNVSDRGYWSSSTSYTDTSKRFATLDGAVMSTYSNNFNFAVWPVRGGR